jgi:hypothetical protein
MYLPSEIREWIQHQQGCTLVWSDRELETLAGLGDAVPVGSRGTFRIPQHHAHTPEDALRIIDGYRHIGETIGWPCVFRGQTRDFYNATGSLIVLPAVARSSRLHLQYLHHHRKFSEAMQPWLAVLESLGINTHTGLEFDHEAPGWDGRVLYGKLRVGSRVALLRANPVVAGILQHYGFPTDHLDVSTDPIVSLWFALHAGEKVRRRGISFRALSPAAHTTRGTPPQPADVADVPTLHVYLQPPAPVEDMQQKYALVYLTRLSTLTAVASRPVRQSAVSLPCGEFRLVFYPRVQLPFVSTNTNLRWPAALIKLYFPFEALDRQDLTQEVLFPRDEPLYRRLLECKVPHLAVYV